jgi:LmbE family N-acetylglucosaminyl deacetylase
VRTLIVAAHPDDEVLGAGGLASRLASNGIEVTSLILCGLAEARTQRPETEDLLRDALAAQRRLGMQEPILGTFPNIRLNTVPHIELVQFIESIIERLQPARIVTHHPGDANIDHEATSVACQAAARLPQRRPGLEPIRELLFMEVPSATDWSLRPLVHRFQPDSFVELSHQHLGAKLEALACYRRVMRPFPHPRSEEVVRGLAAVRGGQAGLLFAEAFQTAFRTI